MRQLPIGLAHIAEREGRGDRNLDAALGDQVDDLAHHLDAVDRVGSLAADTESLHRRVVDDRVDPLDGDAELDGEIDVAAAEGVDERVEATSRGRPDSLRLAVAVDNGNGA